MEGSLLAVVLYQQMPYN